MRLAPSGTRLALANVQLVVGSLSAMVCRSLCSKVGIPEPSMLSCCLRSLSRSLPVRAHALLRAAIPCVSLVAAFAAFTARASAQFTCGTATPVTIGVAFNGNNTSSPGDGIVGLCVQTNRAVWHTFTPTVSGNHTISLCGSAIDSVATLYTACNTQLVACDDNTCGDDALIVFNCTAGQPCLLRVASANFSAGGAYTLLVTPPALSPPSNDACGATIPLQPNTPVRASNAGALGADQTACGVLDTSDVWFSYIPVASGVHRVDICATGFSPVVSLHNTCIGGLSNICAVNTQAGNCVGTEATLNFNASVGQTALIRVAGQRGSFGSFNIVVYSPQTNDICASAPGIQPGVPFNGFTSPILTTDTTVPCAASGADVWARFVPSSSGLHTFSLCSSNFDTVLSVHDSCPVIGGPGPLACNDDFCGTQSSLTLNLLSGFQYLVRIAGKGATPAFGSYTLVVNATAPANDLCTGAITVFENTPVAGTNIGATGTDITPCGNADSKDVWYAFTPPATAFYELNTCSSQKDTTLALFNACNGTLVACNDNDQDFCGVGMSGSLLNIQLSSSIRYLIRIAGPGATEGPFTLTISRTPPANDVCAIATPLVPGTLVSGTLTGASASGLAPQCAVSDAPDVWYAFTPPVSRYYRLDTCGSVLAAVLSVFDGGCPPTGTPVACNAAVDLSCLPTTGTNLTYFFQAGRPYRICIAADPARPTGGAFRLLLSPAAPPNDDCAGALPLVLNTPLLASNMAAVPGTPSAACAIGDTLDVWFRFTPIQSGTYRINTCSGGGTLNTVLTLHTACGQPAQLCSDNEPNCGGNGSQITTSLTAATPVFLRVAGVAGAEGAFSIVVQIAPPSNDTCATARNVGNGTFPFDNLAASTDSAFLDLTCTMGFNLISNDVWFRYTALASGPVRASVCGATFDTAMAVSPASGGCPAGLYSVLDCNDDSVCPSGNIVTPQSTVNWQAVAGSSYFIRVGSRVGATGSGMLAISSQVACPCDIDLNGSLTVADIFAFLNAWFLNLNDFNQDGQSTVQDVFDFLACFFAVPMGCTP